MNADPLGATILRAGRGNPDHGAGNRQLGGIIHQRQQHEHFVADVVIRVVGMNMPPLRKCSMNAA
jgi:hypothetical protein